MNTRFPPNPPPGGILTRVIGALVAIVMMVGLFSLGLVVFAAAAGIALVAFVVFYIRIWWLRRRYGAGPYPGSSRHRKQQDEGDHVTLEGEYREKQD